MGSSGRLDDRERNALRSRTATTPVHFTPEDEVVGE